jgi:hypothetical protein
MLSFLESVTHYNRMMATALKQRQYRLADRVLWSKQKFLHDQVTNSDFYLFDHEYLRTARPPLAFHCLRSCSCKLKNRLTPPHTFLPHGLPELFCPPEMEICPLIDPTDVLLLRPPPLQNLELFMRHSATNILWCNYKAFPIFFRLRCSFGFLSPTAIFFNPAVELAFFGRAILSPNKILTTLGHFNYGPGQSFSGRLSTRFDGTLFSTSIDLSQHPLLETRPEYDVRSAS